MRYLRSDSKKKCAKHPRRRAIGRVSDGKLACAECVGFYSRLDASPVQVLKGKGGWRYRIQELQINRAGGLENWLRNK